MTATTTTTVRRPRVFVFGSNRAGVHGKGSALHAARHHGAVRGVGDGPTGSAYAIPTKDHPHGRIRLVAEIAGSVDRFLAYARAEPGTDFVVVRIGCGEAGYRDAEIAPLFRDAPPNVALPYGWRELASGLTPPPPRSFPETL